MSSHDLPTPKERNIVAAIAAVESYDSPRTRQEDAAFAESRAASKVIKAPDRAFTFFGSRHTIDAESQTVKDLRADLREVMTLVHPEEVSLMLEGRYGTFNHEAVVEQMRGIETVEEAVQKYGEGGVAMWLVADYAKRGVDMEISSSERPESEIAAEVRKDFASDDIATYLMLRQWTSELGGRRTGEYSTINFAKQCIGFAEISGVDWIADQKTEDEIRAFMHDRPFLEAYAAHVAQQFLAHLNKKLGLAISLEDLKNRHTDEVTMRVINELSDPLDHANRQTDVNKISARWNEERDRFLVRSIGEAMNRGKKPYVIFGASHAIHCEPALKKLEVLKS